MRVRHFSIAAAVACCAFAACGGGGGGGNSGGGPPPTAPPTAPPTGTPTPAPSPTSFGCVGVAPFAAARSAMAAPRPVAPGDSSSYTGSLQQTLTQSAPCPQPTATTDAQVTIGVSDTATTAPNGNGATNSTSTETDAYPTHTSTSTTTQLLQISGNQLLLFSSNANDGTGNSLQTAYTNPQEIDDLGGGGTWSNNPAATSTEALADGTRTARNIASDGSYTDTETFADGSKSTISMNGGATPIDGSGQFDLHAGAKCGGEVLFSYAAPASGSITLTITNYAYNSLNQCVQATKTRTFPAWFTVPSSYITDTFADNGLKPFAPSCGVPVSIGTSGTQIVETYNLLDPVLGYTETRTVTTYDVAGYGPACVTIADTLDSYYDYADNTTRIDYQSTNGQPNSVETISEALSMQSAACASGSAPCAQARRTHASALSPAELATRFAAIDYLRGVQRAERIRALHRFALRLAHGGDLR
jgi:hypothetical protein